MSIFKEAKTAGDQLSLLNSLAVDMPVNLQTLKQMRKNIISTVYTINLICLETNECLKSFSSMAIGLVEKQEAQWYQTRKNIKVEWVE